jgi:hypothetical protein
MLSSKMPRRHRGEVRATTVHLLNHGARRGYVVNAMRLPLYPREIKCARIAFDKCLCAVICQVLTD